MKPKLNIFQWAIKFEYQFLPIYESLFFWIMSFIFDKLFSPLLNKRFEICFKSVFSLHQCKRQFQKR